MSKELLLKKLEYYEEKEKKQKSYSKKYYDKAREKEKNDPIFAADIQQKRREYYEKNRDKILDYHADYYYDTVVNLDESLKNNSYKYYKTYYEENKEQIKKQQKKYRDKKREEKHNIKKIFPVIINENNVRIEKTDVNESVLRGHGSNRVKYERRDPSYYAERRKKIQAKEKAKKYKNVVIDLNIRSNTVDFT